MKKVLVAIIVVALAAIAYAVFSDKDSSAADLPSKEKRTAAKQQQDVKVHTGDEPFRIGDGRLEDSWVLFDGVYYCEFDNMDYYMRFYPEGNVTLVGGPKTEQQIPLHQMMRQNIANGESMVHNVLVDINGDSLSFTTKSIKGEIDYKGERVGGDPEFLSFLKHSRINGRKGIFEYRFIPDSEL